MAEPQITFDDGAAYERMMGTWSRLTGEIFLDWIRPEPGLAWIDVGCGNGAFTELLIDRAGAARVEGIDPSQAQINFARSRRSNRDVAHFQSGDARSLPFPNQNFDAAVMALVIFFVPEPAKGVAEMARVVKSGGMISAYAWDVTGGRMPHAAIGKELRGMGFQPASPPSAEASRTDVMQSLWSQAGLQQVETTAIDVRRTFADFDDYWSTTLLAPTIGPLIDTMADEQAAKLKNRVRAALPPDPSGRITAEARANAVRGIVP
jgi:ubiquinone/menaquinone biosynthesis C-methylase UbiE